MRMRPAVSVARLLSVILLALSLVSCAMFTQRDPLNVQVAGIQPLTGEGLELRMAVKLRVQNPNDMALEYNGVALDLEINGRRLASGVSDERGSVPRFGETVLTVPVTISAFSAARQALGLAEDIGMEEVPYVLRGKLAGGLFGTQRFVEKGTLDLSGALANPYRRAP
ncbi:water stress/hypersensitive response domain-containing protein [Pseudomonas sp. MTM4]|uniref:LEA type 2 family protein n=1 Tax=unclassified Pseudomonas TaxID=196821 RepID=UPI0018D209D0|nr:MULTISPECIES: LEA type 2 family protein [unclassified Pseudomonas]MBC8649068.1 water stress/hypersensitive response domain-containing protein [Pseudomonas sp. MT4]QXY93028.1 water stress/hypersensitive response domain-containing protein [Pseudomonas sp. MTM4]